MTICTKCIMDTTDPDIVFDDMGVCSHCHHYAGLARQRVIPDAERHKDLDELVTRIRRAGRGKSYDCIIGISGGVDSTYVAWLVKELGLRPLAVHLDNGWNSELAVANIEKALKALNIDLYTHVIDWEEFRDLQVSFLKASTPDSEVPTDHAIFALLYQLAARHGLRYVLTGVNVASEGVLPKRWGYGYFDWRYITDVHRQFGTVELTTYPHFSLLKLFQHLYLRRVRLVPILNYVKYDKRAAIELLQSKLGWTYYGGKHYESIYTRFFQAYVLPRKFNIDKRKAHLSSLICAGQITRERALELMKEPVYPERLLQEDCEYAVKKLALTAGQFEAIMRAPLRTFRDYRTSDVLFELAKRLLKPKRGYLG
ncbi:MAG: N-acetyl sugar amidotransferase [Proteobacteria bacterium]|nr:N-acetyl sugar amidotransferase [Pseudomonadota bacterium]